MRVKIKKEKISFDVTEHEIDFPYIAFWNGSRNEIIKIYPKYYEKVNKEVISHLVCIKVIHGFGLDTVISKTKIKVAGNVVSEELLIKMRDYFVPGTEEEFNQMKENALKDIE